MASERISRRSVLGSVGAASLAPALLAPTTSQAGLHADLGAEALPPGLKPAFAAQLAVGPVIPLEGHPEQQWALIQGGACDGRLLRGAVQHGRVDWRADPAAGLIEVTARFTVLREDGRLVEVLDRGVHAAPGHTFDTPTICTAPVLMEAGGFPAPAALLVGRLDIATLAAGVLRLHAFEVS